MKALITGVAGFVGSSIAQRLLLEGEQVVGIDALTDYYDVNLKWRNLSRLKHQNFVFQHADINEVDLGALLKGVDVVFHEAGQPGVRKSWGQDFAVYTRSNIDATQRLLEAVKLSSTVRRFVYASSSSVYGDAETFPTLESSPTQPMSPYGVSKLAGEHLCTLYAKNFGIPTVSLRYFTVYGPRQRPDMAFTRFTTAALHDGPIRVFGSGQQIRDFTYIEDIVTANLAAAIAPCAPGSVYNIAGGGHTSVLNVLEMLSSISGRTLRIELAPAVSGDVFRTGGDTSRASHDLHWSPQTDLASGLEAQYQWARDLSRTGTKPVRLSASRTSSVGH